MCIQVHVVSKYSCGLVSKLINLENSEGAIKNEQSRETGNIGYSRGRKTKLTQHNTICVGHHYTQTNTNNVNKTWALLQTTGGTEELNIVL